MSAPAIDRLEITCPDCEYGECGCEGGCPVCLGTCECITCLGTTVAPDPEGHFAAMRHATANNAPRINCLVCERPGPRGRNPIEINWDDLKRRNPRSWAARMRNLRCTGCHREFPAGTVGPSMYRLQEESA